MFRNNRNFADFHICPMIEINFSALSFHFSFSIVATRKFGRSTFERSSISKFETLAILKFDYSKF